MFKKLELFGGLAVNGYGLMIAIGMVLSILAVSRDARRKGLERLDARLHILVLLMLIGGFVGGKLFYALLYRDAFQAGVERHGLLGSMQSGFVFYGSLLFCVPLALWYLRGLGEGVLRSMDSVILCAPVVHGFGRLGCFAAGCCYGTAYDGPLAVTFKDGVGLNHVSVFPIQLLEAGGEFAIFAILWFVVRRRARFNGQVLLTYLALYGALRFGTEFWRGDTHPTLFAKPDSLTPPGVRPYGLTPGQVISLALVPLSMVLLWRGSRRAQSEQ